MSWFVVLQCAFLAGAPKKHGGVSTGSFLHGFSKDVLAEAWDVEESDVDQLLNSQRESAIIKVSKERHSDLWEQFVSKLPHMQKLSDVLRLLDGFTSHRVHHGGEESASWFLGDFVYNLEKASPVDYNEGGEMRAVNGQTLPNLGKFGASFSVCLTALNKGAILSPGWSVNAHTFMYVKNGGARIQIAHPDGTNALDTCVHPGSLVVIPRFYPSVKVASKEGFEFVGVATSSMPFWATLAGHGSILSNMPEVVLRESFNIPQELAKTLRERRMKHSVILPAPTSRVI